eukprot:9441489-Pyramimonas_sp.AAC.1
MCASCFHGKPCRMDHVHMLACSSASAVLHVCTSSAGDPQVLEHQPPLEGRILSLGASKLRLLAPQWRRRPRAEQRRNVGARAASLSS